MAAQKSKKSSKQNLLEHLQANVGKVFTSRQLQRISGGAAEFGRRLRELRAEGWKIETHNDDDKLKPGQWILRNKKKGPAIAFARGVSKETRAFVLERNGNTCQMCGIAAGETHPHDGRKAHLHIGHILDKSKGGSDESSNLRALCSVCNEGAQNITPVPPKMRDLLVAIRRASTENQRAVYDWLRNKFGE